MNIDLKYLAPLAKQLDAWFGTSLPFDLSLFADGHTSGLPPPPTAGGNAAWARWLRDCPDEVTERVLKGIDSVAGGVSPEVVVARTELIRANILQRKNVAEKLVVNRRKLLDHVKAMLHEKWRILRVEGKRGEGKTFTRCILQWIHSEAMGGDHRIADVDVPKSLGLEALAREICNKVMGNGSVQLPNRMDTTVDKWVELLADTVVRAATGTPGTTWWLVLDNCSRITADEIVMFLRRLAEKVEMKQQHTRAPRLVLIDAPSDITTRNGDVLLQEILTTVSRQDLEEFFVNLANVHESLPQSKFAGWVERVLAAMTGAKAAPSAPQSPSSTRDVTTPPTVSAPNGQTSVAEAQDEAGALLIYPLINMHECIQNILQTEGGLHA